MKKSLLGRIAVLLVLPFVIRQAKTSLLAEVPEAPELEGVDMNPGERSDSQRPDWLTETKISQHLLMFPWRRKSG